MKKNQAYPRAGAPRSLAVSRAHEGGGDAEKTGVLPVLSGALRALPVSILSGFLLLLVCSGIAYAQADPDAFLTPLGVGAAGLSAVIGGIAAVRFNRGGALLSGLCGGILYTGILMILSLCFFRDAGSGYSPAVSLFLHAGIILLEVLGGFLGLPRKKSPAPGRHRVPR